MLTTFGSKITLPPSWLRYVRATAAAAAAVALLFGAAGCQSLSGSAGKEPAPAPLGLPQSTVPRAQVMDETPLIVSDILPERDAGQQDQLILPERQPPRTSRVQIAEYPQNLIRDILDPDEKIGVMFNFDAAALTEIVPLFAELLNFNYLIDPNVKGAITMTVEAEMTAREAWEAFEHILWLAGAYASRNPGFIHIMPFNKMPQERRLLARHDPHANVEVALLAINNTTSSEIASQIRPFMTDGATVTDIVRLNTLLIVEAPANMPKLRELIEILDRRGEAQWPQICLRIHQVDVETVKEELEKLLPVIGLPVAAGGGPSGGAIKLVAVPRLQVLVASAALQEVLLELERWVRVLDNRDSSEQENLFFYNVRHSTAEELNNALGVFFNTSSTSSTTRTVSGESSTAARAVPGGGSTAAANVTRRTPSPAAAGGSGNGVGEASNIFETPVVIYADKLNNRLTIRTTQRAYAMVRAMLSRLDVPPRQVMIQAMIAEIKLTDSTEFGFAYAALKQDGRFGFAVDNNTGIDWFDNKTLKTIEPILLTRAWKGISGGGIALNMSRGDQLAAINAIAGQGNSRVLSAPQIIAVTGEEARISVGQKISVQTGESTINSTTSSYQYLETGTIMTVTPYITAGNDVRTVIRQEVSSAVQTKTDAKNPNPDISTKLLNSTMIIPDGGTVMMGGLIDTVESRGHAGIPLLKDIPYLGNLFRTHAKSSSRVELLVLITVNVISSDNGTEAIAIRYQEALAEIRKQMSPFFDSDARR